MMMDGYDPKAQDAASVLLFLHEKGDKPFDTSARRTISNDSKSTSGVQEDDGPTNEVTPQGSTYVTPVRKFKYAGLKRERDDTYTLFYKSGGDQISVPFSKGDSVTTLFTRRDEEARRLVDPARGTVFCSWKAAVMSLVVHDPRWVPFRASTQQKRYHYKSIQLIVNRYTCTQWRSKDDPCRSCIHRKWRMKCSKPTVMMYVMPLPSNKHDSNACDQSLTEFDPKILQDDESPWKQRLPQIHIR